MNRVTPISFGLSIRNFWAQDKHMSYGLPCIAFDTSDGAKELLKNNVGILVKDRNKEKMAEEIIKELKNKNGSEHSEKGYKYCQKYLLDNVKKEWINILK